MIGLYWFRIRLVEVVTEDPEVEATEEVVMEDRVVETMEEVLREAALQLPLRRLRPVVLHPREVLELVVLEDKAVMGREGTDRVVTEEMEEVMEEEVATAEEATEVAMGEV